MMKVNTSGFIKEEVYLWGFLSVVNETYDATEDIIHTVSEKITVKTECCKGESVGIPKCDNYF